MIVLREFDFNVNFGTGLSPDQLIFKSGNKRTRTKLKRIIITLAADKLNPVDRTDKINHNDIALGCFFAVNFDGFLAGIGQITDRLVDLFRRNFGSLFVQNNL